MKRKYFTIHTVADLAERVPLSRSVRRRRSEVDLSPEELPYLLHPGFWIGAVDDAPQEAQPFTHVILIAPDILLGDSCIQGEETFHASWFSKDVGSMAELRRLNHDCLLQVEDVFTRETGRCAPRKLAVKKWVIIRT